MSHVYDPYAVFSFEGRIRRRDWWLTCLLVNFTATTSGFILSVMLPGLALVIALGLNALASWMVLAASVKRAHDRNDSGALPIINFVLGWLIATAALLSLYFVQNALPKAMLSWFLVAFAFVNAAISIWLIVVLGFLDGTPGTNQYGLSPKGFKLQDYRAPPAD